MEVPGLTISELADRQILVFSIAGEIPRDMLGAMQEAILGAIRRCTRAVIADFSRAVRISSSGPGLLTYYARLLGTQGTSVLAVRAPAEVMRRLEPTGITRVVPFYDSLEAALESTGLARSTSRSELTWPARLKLSFLAKLRGMNIAANSLFPGIDGIGRSVTELVMLANTWAAVESAPDRSTREHCAAAESSEPATP
jgi:anti-anti-sigma regulatory factor